jgi:hypothetical protein
MTDFPATDWSRYDVPTISGMLLGDDDGESLPATVAAIIAATAIGFWATRRRRRTKP